jgi:hypothetical protein
MRSFTVYGEPVDGKLCNVCWRQEPIGCLPLDREEFDAKYGYILAGILRRRKSGIL